MADKIIRTGGDWDPKRWPVYFAASNPSVFVESIAVQNHILLAINELEGDQWKEVFATCFREKKALFIDSGVYSLSMQHAVKHHISMDQALALAPDKVDGFKALFDKYVEIIRAHGDKVWGYVEIDQGGRANKIKTRAKLEKLGLRPIPVYHPFNDGWDYFDYLAQRYDRICFGNVVQADPPTRKRLAATAWERRRKYPHLWIHLLGMTPSTTLTAFPINSCDSSTWIGSLRWDQQHTHIAGQAVELDVGFTYVLASIEPTTGSAGWNKGVKLSGYNGTMLGRLMANMARDQERFLGADIGMFNRRAKR